MSKSFKQYLSEAYDNIGASNAAQSEFYKKYEERTPVPTLLPADIIMSDYRFEQNKWGIIATLDDHYDGEESARWALISGNTRADVEQEIQDYVKISKQLTPKVLEIIK